MTKTSYKAKLDGNVCTSNVIHFIDNEYPEAKGLCYYDDKELKSKKPATVAFYFDPFHSVVEVTFYKWTRESFEVWLNKHGLQFENVSYNDEQIVTKNGERIGVTVDRQEDYDSGEIEEAVEAIIKIKI